MHVFEFAVKGPPVGVNAKEHSAVSRKKYRDWMARVAAAASDRLEPDWHPTKCDEIVVAIFNYYSGGFHDVDNVIKPIFDALSGVLYEDDRQIYKVTSERFDRSQSNSILDPSAVLVIALDAYLEFVHVIVSWERG